MSLGTEPQIELPPIPVGWEAVPLSDPFPQLMAWTALDAESEPVWTRMVVLKILSANRKDGYTHDVHVFGTNARQKRGIRLRRQDHISSSGNATVHGLASSKYPPLQHRRQLLPPPLHHVDVAVA